jgi:hypothetical protein
MCTRQGAQLSYGDMQRDHLQYYCEQQLSCNMQQGIQSGTVDGCIKINITSLNSYDEMRRILYEREVMECGGMVGCAFVGCFQFPP